MLAAKQALRLSEKVELKDINKNFNIYLDFERRKGIIIFNHLKKNI